MAGATVSVPHSSENPAGRRSTPYQRFLPQGVRKGWLRLTFTLTPVSGKSVTQGSIFAALLREEDLPYQKALMAQLVTPRSHDALEALLLSPLQQEHALI